MKSLIAALMMLASLLSFNAASAAPSCLAFPPQRGSSNPPTFSSEVLKRTQIQYAKEDIADFCERNMIHRYLNVRDLPPPRCESLPILKLEEYADSHLPSSDQSWQNALVSTPKSRDVGYRGYLKAGIAVNDFSSTEHIRDYFKTENQPENMVVKILAGAKADLSNFDSLVSGILDVVSNGGVDAVGECISHSGFRASSCLNALKILRGKVRVALYGQVPFTNIELWKKIYSTKKYDEGLRLAALQVAERMLGDLQENDNIFDDLLVAFHRSGMSSVEAIDATWTVLGVIANGGQNTLSRTVLLEWPSQKSQALGYIANSMTAIDLKKRQKNLSLYSFPLGIETNCDTGKPYHFWMSAYLARNLVKDEKIESNVAIAAVYISQKMYQVQRGALNAQIKSKGAIFTRPPYDPSHQIIRTDLAFAAAGAVFGALSDNTLGSKKINVDSAIVKLLEDSSVRKPLDKAAAEKMTFGERYSEFEKIFSPESALKNIINEQNIR